MKIKYQNQFDNKEFIFESLTDAIEHSLTPDPYSYSYGDSSGLNELKAEHKKLKEMLIRMLEARFDNHVSINLNEQLNYILGSAYEVTDDA